MAGAIRARTIQKGHDPREFTLVAFGGGGPLAAADVADILGAPEVLVPPFPGITAATGLLTSDLKYDQMRTVFMVQGAIDGDLIDRQLEGIAAELRQRLRDDGVTDEDIQVAAALDCRYLGQGYELRVPLPEGRFTEGALDAFHGMHRQEYGHAFADPIEVVNLRVTAIGVRPKVERLPLSEGTMAEALIGEGEGVFRVDGALASLPTRHYERSRLPVGERFEGPAIVFQRDTTVLVPPGWSGCAQPSGNLILAR
jgi:N-methylhydantoinase A